MPALRLSLMLLARIRLLTPPYTTTPAALLAKISFSLTRVLLVPVITTPARMAQSGQTLSPPPFAWIMFPRKVLFGPATHTPERALEDSVLLSTVVELPLSITPDCWL